MFLGSVSSRPLLQRMVGSNHRRQSGDTGSECRVNLATLLQSQFRATGQKSIEGYSVKGPRLPVAFVVFIVGGFCGNGYGGNAGGTY